MQSKKMVFWVLLVFSTVFCAEEIKWNSYKNGVAMVEKFKKPAIVDFYADWCGYCKKMEKTTYSDPQIVKKLKKEFITIKINTDKDTDSIFHEGKKYTVQQFMQALGIMGMPATLFMDANKKLITVMPGYVGPETFLPLLEYMGNRCYEKQVAFKDYMDKKVECK